MYKCTILGHQSPELVLGGSDVSAGDELVCKKLHHRHPLSIFLLQARGDESTELRRCCAVRQRQQLKEADNQYLEAMHI